MSRKVKTTKYILKKTLINSWLRELGKKKTNYFIKLKYNKIYTAQQNRVFISKLFLQFSLYRQKVCKLF